MQAKVEEGGRSSGPLQLGDSVQSVQEQVACGTAPVRVQELLGEKAAITAKLEEVTKLLE